MSVYQSQVNTFLNFKLLSFLSQKFWMIAVMQKLTEVWVEMKYFKIQVDVNYNLLLWKKNTLSCKIS